MTKAEEMAAEAAVVEAAEELKITPLEAEPTFS